MQHGIHVGIVGATGYAGQELVRLLAEAFGVPRRQVAILRGETSRDKLVRVDAPVRRPDLVWR